MIHKTNEKIVVGLTGGIASGKSSVLRIFKKYGFKTVDSDKIVHHLLKNNKFLIRRIGEKFGKKIFGGKGKINRKALGKIVFGDKKKLKMLESIVHPELLNRIKLCIKNTKKGRIIVDVPLLFEKRWDKYFDYTLTVYCPEEIQVMRLSRRDDISRKEARKRIALQKPLSGKIRMSDFTIDTGSGRADTEESVREVIGKLNG